jgi:hypothetical protein
MPTTSGSAWEYGARAEMGGVITFDFELNDPIRTRQKTSRSVVQPHSLTACCCASRTRQGSLDASHGPGGIQQHAGLRMWIAIADSSDSATPPAAMFRMRSALPGMAAGGMHASHDVPFDYL